MTRFFKKLITYLTSILKRSILAFIFSSITTELVPEFKVTFFGCEKKVRWAKGITKYYSLLTFGSSAVITPNLSCLLLMASLTSAFFSAVDVAWWIFTGLIQYYAKSYCAESIRSLLQQIHIDISTSTANLPSCPLFLLKSRSLEGGWESRQRQPASPTCPQTWLPWLLSWHRLTGNHQSAQPLT